MRKKSNPIVESMYKKYAIPTGKNIRQTLKESMKEIDRRYFASLNKEEDGHYYILVDGNYEKDFYADSDEEAKRKFAEWNGKAESLTEKLSDEEKQARREWRAFEKINNSFDDSDWNNWNQEQRDMFCDKVAQRFLKVFPHPTQMFFDWLEAENFHTQSRAFDRLLSEALTEARNPEHEKAKSLTESNGSSIRVVDLVQIIPVDTKVIIKDIGRNEIVFTGIVGIDDFIQFKFESVYEIYPLEDYELCVEIDLTK